MTANPDDSPRAAIDAYAEWLRSLPPEQRPIAVVGEIHDSHRFQPPALFFSGLVQLHSGEASDWKIDCDALTDADWANVAWLIAHRIKFGDVVGVPRGGLALADALRPYCTSGPRLVVDDVLTTGRSMEEFRKSGDVGVVLFARGACPEWILPLFTASEFLLTEP